MLEKSEKNMKEIEAAFTFAMLLLNILFVAIVGTVIWILHSAFTQPSPLYTILRGDILP
jgi:hypothetical protein